MSFSWKLSEITRQSIADQFDYTIDEVVSETNIAQTSTPPKPIQEYDQKLTGCINGGIPKSGF